MHKYIKAFVIASSLPATFIALIGLAIGAKRSGSDFDFSLIGILIPLIFGLFNALTHVTAIPRTRLNMFYMGAALGVFLSSLGTFVFNVPELVYGLQGNVRFIALLIGPLFYGLLWTIIVYYLEKLILENNNNLLNSID